MIRPLYSFPIIRLPILALPILAVVLSGCDVLNPGPIDDESLTDASAHQALVNGAGRTLLVAVNEIGYTGAVVAREVFPGGQSGNFGHAPLIQAGALPDDEVDVQWENAHQARYIAEEAIRRYSPAEVGVDPDVLAQAYVWAGYANRVLGENMCEAVFDGGPAEPNIRYFERAEAHFTSAMEVATDDAIRMAARAGRAQVRVWLDDWVGATEDAAAVPRDFAFHLNASGVDQDTYNMFYYGGIANPYSGYSVWNTYVGTGDAGVAGDYYGSTGDPRVPWTPHPQQQFAGASLTGYGQVPLHIQLKYPNVSADYELANGREMMLIRAEALLREGGWEDAIDLINEVRAGLTSDLTGVALEPWTAGSEEEAWTRLKHERAIELWLEARRLGDLRRWEAAGTPGDPGLPDFGAATPFFDEAPDDRCFPIPESEREANPNLPG